MPIERLSPSDRNLALERAKLLIPRVRELAFAGQEERFFPENRRWIPKFSPIVVWGLPGSGNTTFSEELAKELSIPIFNAGKVFRLIVDTHVIGATERDPALDFAIDLTIADLIRISSPQNPILIEAKNGGNIVNGLIPQLLEMLEVPENAVRMIITARSKVRHARVLARERLRKPNLTLKEVKRLSDQRVLEGDITLWKSMYEDYVAALIYDPSGKDMHGRPLVDIQVSTTNRTAQEAVEKTIPILVARGNLEPKQGISMPFSPGGGVIFQL